MLKIGTKVKTSAWLKATIIMDCKINGFESR